MATTWADERPAFRLQPVPESQAHTPGLRDPVSGLPGPALLVDSLDHALRRCGRSHQSLAVAIVELDSFATLRHRSGAAASERLLAEIGRRLQHILRPGDTVAQMTPGRFALLCEEVASVRDAGAIAARAACAVALPVVLAGSAINLTASVGITRSRPGVDDVPDLLRRAADALEGARFAGPGRVRVEDATV